MEGEPYAYHANTAPRRFPEHVDPTEAYPNAPKRKSAAPAPAKMHKGVRLWLYVMFFGVAVAICGTMIVVKAERITTLNRANSLLADEIDALNAQYAEKLTAYENATDIEYIRKQASEVLGMSNPSPEQLVSLGIDLNQPQDDYDETPMAGSESADAFEVTEFADLWIDPAQPES